MFKNLKDNEIAILKNYKQEILHTLFVFYPIDIIGLDKNNKVAYIKRNIKPFRFYIKPNKKVKNILEFKAGKSKSIKIGQRIKI